MQVLGDEAEGGAGGSLGAGGDGVSNVAGSSSGLGAVLLVSSGDNANTSNNISQANSAVSIEFAEQQVASTIGSKYIISIGVFCVNILLLLQISKLKFIGKTVPSPATSVLA